MKKEIEKLLRECGTFSEKDPKKEVKYTLATVGLLAAIQYIIQKIVD